MVNFNVLVYSFQKLIKDYIIKCYKVGIHDVMSKCNEGKDNGWSGEGRKFFSDM